MNILNLLGLGLVFCSLAITFVVVTADRRRNKSIAEFEARRRRKSMAPCPINANHDTSPFSSTQDLWCHDCRLFHPWLLKAGQSPLVTSSKDRGIQS